MRIGTRGSALALAQAEWVAARLGPGCELVTVTTAGDRGAMGGDKSRWVTELERALLEDRIDVAVHSAKDVPTVLGEGLALLAIPARADPHDVICGAPSLSALGPAARVGTSSLRRASQIRAERADLEVVELRGNVDTRLGKLARGECDALVIAMAGLQRLGREEESAGRLGGFVPAAGQGALALEGRPGALAPDSLRNLDDPATSACVKAERALVEALGASCNTPLGAHARLATGHELEMTTWLGLPDGSAWLRDRVQRPPETVATEAARRLRAAGAEALLAQAEQAA